METRIKISHTTAYTAVVSAFIAVLLISNIASTKLFGLWQTNIIIDGGTILFPFAYILGDVITEVYGLKRAHKIIVCGFVAMVLMSLTLYAVQLLPAAEGWQGQEAYETILGLVPRIMIGSLVAYLAGILTNAYVMAKLKNRNNTSRLWARALSSTAVGALIDTTLFSFVAFYGTIPFDALIGLIITVYCIKLVVVAVALPITYRAVHFLETIEINAATTTKHR